MENQFKCLVMKTDNLWFFTAETVQKFYTQVFRMVTGMLPRLIDGVIRDPAAGGQRSPPQQAENFWLFFENATHFWQILLLFG